MKFKSLESFARDIMEKRNLSDKERQMHDMHKHLSPDGQSLNPNYAKIEKDQTAPDTPAIDKETDKSVVDINPEVAKADSMVDTKKDEKDNNVTDTSSDVGKAQGLERAQRVIKIRNIRAQNKLKITDNV